MNTQPSAADFIQASRVLRLHSPLGENVLLPERVHINEGVNQLFEIEVSVRSKVDIAPADLIGKLVDIEVEIQAGEGDDEPVYRCWNGLVTELHEGPAVTRALRSYHLLLRPSLWLLSQTRDSRIWMDVTTLDVLDTLLNEHGLNRADAGGVLKPAAAIHFSTQFNESDLRYLLRRFEQDGYFWWFSHKRGAHTLHVANHPSGWLQPSDAVGGDGRVRLAMGSSDRNHIREWTRRFAYVPGVRAGADWNYKTFGSIPLNSMPSQVDLPDNAKREVFEWPARAMAFDEAEQSQKLRSQASEADYERVVGSSTVRILEPGRRFTPYNVANHEAKFEEHVVTAVKHVVVDRSYETDSSSEPEYRNSFEAIPSRIPLTPHRSTPKPKIEGLQVAVVAGPVGEEIHCDEDGCIKLWFPWQRHRAKKDGSDTKWIRVATNWAGQGWGGQVIPRIGMEVLTAFLDSDPDRPVVIGVVPNPANAVPYDLPGNKTKTVFRTNTHKGSGFNELTFEDEREQEEIYVHAQKDMNIDILHDRTKAVGHDQSESVGNNKSISVARNHTETIGANKTLSVTNAFARSVGKVSTEQVGILKSTFVGGDQLVVVGANKEESVGKGLNYSAGETIGFDAGRVFEIKAGDTFRVRVGDARFEMDKSGVVVIEAPQTTIVKGGGAQLTVGPGPILHSPDIVPGKSPVPPAQCLRKMAAQRVPFIKQDKNA